LSVGAFIPTGAPTADAQLPEIVGWGWKLKLAGWARAQPPVIQD
jgi:hypothetical protein